jgi:hypothetical protein
MKQQRKVLSIFFLFGFWIAIVQGQETTPVTGGNATGTGGTVSYTIGQVVYTTISCTTGTITQGVQQPFEILVVTGTKKELNLILEVSVYPNPTRGPVKLIVESFEHENLRFHLYDISGVILQDKKVESRETEVSFENLPSSIYFLKVFNNNKEVKVFKIVKN